ncbi:nuclear RNA export factor 1 isoform X2 [Cryptotermes secundus]|uniref:nuclear RNA export factor 1 isoform X2 n=1 Tax=Cryptotermes secundus TaxID=105785 RepID=UPI000CD7D685|nr:nuclear RNA export factor 1 isoform X2 [Cryptotermes secundus]
MIHIDPKSEPAEENRPDRIVITKANALYTTFGSSYCMERFFINRTDCWHKFTILHGRIHDKEFILKLIMDNVYPVELFPVMNIILHSDMSSKILAGSGKTSGITWISRIWRQGIKVELEIILAFAHINDILVNVHESIIKVMNKRFNKSTKHLDLSNFHRDPDLRDLVFCPLSQATIFHHVLNAFKSNLPPVKSLNLSHNDICSLKSLEAMWQRQQPLVKVDLRHNMIKHVRDLEVLRQLQVTELLLDQNPLCQHFDSEYSYTSAVRGVLPSLVKLDGVVLGPPNVPRIKRNFVRPLEDTTLADQFVRHFFTLYDGDNRMKLGGMYHGDALFSLSSTYLPAQSTSSTARLTEYTIESRNLLKLSDYSKGFKLLRHGADAILPTICKLPRSEHDPYSFTVDLIHSASSIVISVTGVFREPTIMKSPLIRSFCRVFVLVQIGPRDYQIANETMHVKNATTEEAEVAFKIPKPSVGPKVAPGKGQKLSASDKEQMTKVLSHLTEMNVKWSRKCLEESKWNVKKALTMFTELYKISKIPPEAFSTM